MFIVLLDLLLPWIAEIFVTGGLASVYRRFRYRGLRNRVLAMCQQQQWAELSGEFRMSMEPVEQMVVLDLMDRAAVEAMPEVLSHAFTAGDQWMGMSAMGVLKRTKTAPPEVVQVVNELEATGRMADAVRAQVNKAARA